MASCAFWSHGLRANDATGGTWRNTNSVRFSDNVIELFCKHSGNAATMSPKEAPLNTFDTYAADYDSALMKGLSISGEDTAFFARPCSVGRGSSPRTQYSTA